MWLSGHIGTKYSPLDIEFEETDLFTKAINGTDVDMHEGDDSTGAKEASVDDVG